MMCLFLWQASIYPVLGQGSKNGALLSYPNNIAQDESKSLANANNNLPGSEISGVTKIAVKQGETLWHIAQEYHSTVGALVKLNHLTSPDQIKAGVSILVQKGEDSLAQTESPDVSNESSIKTYNIIVNNNPQEIDKSSQNTSGTEDEEQNAGAQSETPLGNENQVPSRSLGRLVSKGDVELLTRVIYGEARGENFEGQVAVGAVVLNRLKDPRFPKTIRDIIYQSGAFTAVDDQQIHLTPDAEAYKAAIAALSGMDPTNGAIYYYNPRLATDRWIKSRTVIKRIGNHNFSI